MKERSTALCVAWLCACFLSQIVNADREVLMSESMMPDTSPHLSASNSLQFAFMVNSELKLEAQGSGGLRLALMRNLTDFDRYIIIVINEEILLRECFNDNTEACGGGTISHVEPPPLFEMEPMAPFWLMFDDRKFELRGGYDRSKDNVLVNWMSSSSLDWVRLVTIGVQYESDWAPHIVSVHRDVDENQCVVMMNEAATLRQLGDNFIDKPTCQRYGGCYKSDRPPFCYFSIARVKAGDFNASEQYQRSLRQLLNGTYLAVAQSSLSSSSTLFYVDDTVVIVYAVGVYVDNFSYRLEIGSGAETTQIALHDFDDVELVRNNVTYLDWPSQVPYGTLGGVAVQRFSQPGICPVVLVVSGRMTINGPEESIREETSVIVSTRPTLQEIVNPMLFVCGRPVYRGVPVTFVYAVLRSLNHHHRLNHFARFGTDSQWYRLNKMRRQITNAWLTTAGITEDDCVLFNGSSLADIRRQNRRLPVLGNFTTHTFDTADTYEVEYSISVGLETAAARLNVTVLPTVNDLIGAVVFVGKPTTYVNEPTQFVFLAARHHSTLNYYIQYDDSSPEETFDATGRVSLIPDWAGAAVATMFSADTSQCRGAVLHHVYATAGQYTARVRVTLALQPPSGQSDELVLTVRLNATVRRRTLAQMMLNARVYRRLPGYLDEYVVMLFRASEFPPSLSLSVDLGSRVEPLTVTKMSDDTVPRWFNGESKDITVRRSPNISVGVDESSHSNPFFGAVIGNRFAVPGTYDVRFAVSGSLADFEAPQRAMIIARVVVSETRLERQLAGGPLLYAQSPISAGTTAELLVIVRRLIRGVVFAINFGDGASQTVSAGVFLARDLPRWLLEGTFSSNGEFSLPHRSVTYYGRVVRHLFQEPGIYPAVVNATGTTGGHCEVFTTPETVIHVIDRSVPPMSDLLGDDSLVVTSMLVAETGFKAFYLSAHSVAGARFIFSFGDATEPKEGRACTEWQLENVAERSIAGTLSLDEARQGGAQTAACVDHVYARPGNYTARVRVVAPPSGIDVRTWNIGGRLSVVPRSTTPSRPTTVATTTETTSTKSSTLPASTRTTSAISAEQTETITSTAVTTSYVSPASPPRTTEATTATTTSVEMTPAASSTLTDATTTFMIPPSPTTTSWRTTTTAILDAVTDPRCHLMPTIIISGGGISSSSSPSYSSHKSFSLQVTIMQYCPIPLSPVVWSVFARWPSSSSSVPLPDEQRLYFWVPEKVGKHQIVVRPFTLEPGDYRFEAKITRQRIDYTADSFITIVDRPLHVHLRPDNEAIVDVSSAINLRAIVRSHAAELETPQHVTGSDADHDDVTYDWYCTSGHDEHAAAGSTALNNDSANACFHSGPKLGSELGSSLVLGASQLRREKLPSVHTVHVLAARKSQRSPPRRASYTFVVVDNPLVVTVKCEQNCQPELDRRRKLVLGAYCSNSSSDIGQLCSGSVRWELVALCAASSESVERLHGYEDWTELAGGSATLTAPSDALPFTAGYDTYQINATVTTNNPAKTTSGFYRFILTPSPSSSASDDLAESDELDSATGLRYTMYATVLVQTVAVLSLAIVLT